MYFFVFVAALGFDTLANQMLLQLEPHDQPVFVMGFSR
jgi:hypothetical protein